MCEAYGCSVRGERPVEHSVTASVWDAQRYDACMLRLYTALSFAGLTIGFVTERQLERGPGIATAQRSSPALLIPSSYRGPGDGRQHIAEIESRLAPVSAFAA